MEVLMWERVNDLRHSLFHLLNYLIATASELREIPSHRELVLDNREGEELSWRPSWPNSLWQGWSCGLVHCPGGNTTDLIWRVLASSDRISSWTPLKPQYSNPNPLANQLWCIDFLTPPIALIIPHRLRAFVESLMPLKNWCSIHARWSKSSLKHSIRFCGIFPSLKHNFITYRSSKVSSRPDCIFEIHPLWQSGFSRVYSNCCCSCSFEPEIMKICQSSHKMYSNKILNFQESTTILNACTKKSGNPLWHHVYSKIGQEIYSQLVSPSYILPQLQGWNWSPIKHRLKSLDNKCVSFS